LRLIVGCGNPIRGEDAFGLDVIAVLQSKTLKNTKLLSLRALTPETILEFLDVDEVIFIDACYAQSNHYALACTLKTHGDALSHHISPQMLISLTREVYKKPLHFMIFSMLTESFENIEDRVQYRRSIEKTAAFLGE
jgi:hydrogenase maturation protease